jgi:hypothetical protein
LWPGYACYDQNKRKPLEAILILNLEVQCQNQKKKELFIGRVRDQSDHPYGLTILTTSMPAASAGCTVEKIVLENSLLIWIFGGPRMDGYSLDSGRETMKSIGTHTRLWAFHFPNAGVRRPWRSSGNTGFPNAFGKNTTIGSYRKCRLCIDRIKTLHGTALPLNSLVSRPISDRFVPQTSAGMHLRKLWARIAIAGCRA